MILEQFFTDCRTESRTLISATTFPDNYQSICEHITNWFEQKLLQYCPQDREYIAQYTLGIAATIGDEFVKERPFGQEDVSLAFFYGIFQGIKDYLAPSGLNQLIESSRFMVDAKQLCRNTRTTFKIRL